MICWIIDNQSFTGTWTWNIPVKINNQGVQFYILWLQIDEKSANCNPFPSYSRYITQVIFLSKRVYIPCMGISHTILLKVSIEKNLNHATNISNCQTIQPIFYFFNRRIFLTNSYNWCFIYLWFVKQNKSPWTTNSYELNLTPLMVANSSVIDCCSHLSYGYWNESHCIYSLLNKNQTDFTLGNLL